MLEFLPMGSVVATDHESKQKNIFKKVLFE